uniref:Uncharacterized protein n=1 Tax=Panagrolaimus sp. ES5 TaxID=591445 RepID=A0AC34FWT6_9BILA
MFCLLSTLRHSLIYFFLLWTAISSLPTPSNLQQQYNNRRRLQRDTSKEFPQHGSLDLVLQNDFLEFQICCTKDGGCYHGDFQFCFETKQRMVDVDHLYGCGEGTCAYKLKYDSKNGYIFFGGIFNTSDKCFTGKVTNENVYVSYLDTEKESPGCPLAIESGNRLKIHVRSIPDGVTVTATNAQKYVEPTTSTSSSLQNSNETIPQTKLEDKEGMSDGLKYGLIGIGVLVFLLIVGGGIYGIYTWRKSDKNPKPTLLTTVIKDEKPNEKIETKTKPLEVKQKAVKNMKNEIKKDEKRPKAPPTNVISSAEPEPSKEPITKPSAEPEPPQQISKEPSVVPPSAEPSKPPPELPKATITIGELITRAERNRHRGKMGDTFDRLKKPAFENIFESMIRHKWIS